jgi:AcrR family transcriptional regulator
MPRPRTDIRPRILEAARERFAIAGVDGSSLRSIAADAGTSIGMIYYYFPTKEDLFLAVVEDVYVQLLADLEAALGADSDFAQSVLALYRRIGAVSALELQVIRLVAREALTSGERLKSLIRRFSRGHIPLIFKAISRGLAHGELRTDVHLLVLMAATITLGTLPQLAIRTVGKQLPIKPPSAEELTRQLARALLEGIGSRG